MADDASKPVKLPFAPTALGKLPFKPRRDLVRSLSGAEPLRTESKSTDPTSSNRNADDADQDLDLFKRGREMKSKLAADREREARKRQKRLQEEEERQLEQQLSEITREATSSKPVSAPLAQVTSIDSDDDAFSSPNKTPPSKRSRLATPPTRETRSSRSTRSRRILSPPTLQSPTPVSSSTITIEDSDSESDVKPVQRPAPPRRSSTPDFSLAANDVDDDMAEYVRRARLAKEAAAKDNTASDFASDAFSSPAPQRKAAVEIVLTSSIPGTRSSGAKVPFDKPLRIVRDSWVALQHKYGCPLPSGLSGDDVILTWRRKKVYMSSSLQSLHIRPLPDGRVGATGSNSSDGFNETRTRVHMELWAPEDFAQWEREEKARRLRLEDGNMDDEDDEANKAEEQEQPKLRLILKPRDLEPFKVAAHAETTIGELLLAFRKARSVDDDTDIALYFDGEKLEEDATVQDADIDDMDTLEVHIKSA